MHREETAREKRREAERKERLEKAAALIKKYPDKEDLFGSYYGEKDVVCTYDGTIDFNPVEGIKRTGFYTMERFNSQTEDTALNISILTEWKDTHMAGDWIIMTRFPRERKKICP